MSTTLTPILTKFWDDPQSWTLETYEKNDGYQALKKALATEPAVRHEARLERFARLGTLPAVTPA